MFKFLSIDNYYYSCLTRISFMLILLLFYCSFQSSMLRLTSIQQNEFNFAGRLYLISDSYSVYFIVFILEIFCCALFEMVFLPRYHYRNVYVRITEYSLAILFSFISFLSLLRGPRSTIVLSFNIHWIRRAVLSVKHFRVETMSNW